MSKPAILALGALLGILTACADTSTLPRLSPAPATPLESSAGAVDPEPQWPIRIKSVGGNIDLPTEGSFLMYPTTIGVSGYMNYDAYHARIQAKLTVAGRNTSYQDFFPREKHTSTFFDNDFYTYWDALLGGPCGNSLQLDLEFTAWWLGLSGWVMQQENRPLSVPEQQPACRTSGGGGGGGGDGGGGMLTCYTETVYHYWYYPDTGVIEYRYTSEHQWCEPKEYAS
jgi:hypothetical protein